jgi:nicotinate phosphoribosyltransferase
MVAFEDEGGEWVSVAKRSVHKTNVGGRKFALRRHNPDGLATAEVLAAGRHPNLEMHDRELLVPLIIEGEIQSEFTSAAGTARAKAHHAEVIKSLPLSGLRLMRGEAAIPTEFI